MRRPSVSVCMIVRDEEKNLPRLFSSIEGFADEVIVVDTGSADGTVDIAGRLGAKVYHFDWCDDFSAARNESLKHATKEFILWLDADDELKREGHETIRRHLAAHPGCGVYLKVDMATVQAMQVRVFPNHRGVRFEGRIHEQVIGSMEKKGVPVLECDAVIVHHGYTSEEVGLEKLKRNRRILEREAEENPKDINALFFLARTLAGEGELERALVYLDAVETLGKREPSLQEHTCFKLGVIDRASILHRLGRSQEALSSLLAYKARFPRLVPLRSCLGKLYFDLKEYEKAFDELLPLKEETFERELLPLNPADMRKMLLSCLGVSALFAGRPDLADDCLTKAVGMEPTELASYHYLSLARERRGDVDGAMRACRTGLLAAGHDGYLNKRLFLLLVKKGDMEAAVRSYETLNGCATDTDALAARFLIACKALSGPDIQRCYRLLRGQLSMAPTDFPQDLAATKARLAGIGDPKASELFDSAVSFLLEQA